MGRVSAWGRTADGPVHEIAPAKWAYLKVFEENDEDVFKYTARDSGPAFRDVKLRSEVVQNLWPPSAPDAGRKIVAESPLQAKKLPRLQAEIREVAQKLWPDGKMPVLVKERDRAIRDQMKPPPSERTIRRALKDSGHSA
jgi:hypothetical protein